MPLRFLLDMGISPLVIGAVSELGHSAEHARDIGLRQAPDSEIVQFAGEKDLIVVTTDKDLANLVARNKLTRPSVITLRLNNPSAEEQIESIRGFLSKMEPSILRGALISLQKGRYRRRDLPVILSEEEY